MSLNEPHRYNWESTDNLLLFNPRSRSESKAELKKLVQQTSLVSHCFISTSGTSQTSTHERWVALSKGSILVSALQINQLLESSSNDIWISPLPDFHIGGLSIWARAYLSNAKVVALDSKWSCDSFIGACSTFLPTLCSLVPTQLFDLVQSQIQAPPSLRCVFVGGGALPNELHSKALELGWKIALTYGMTETASQVATSKIGERKLYVLPHLEVDCRDHYLQFKGASLFTGYLSDLGFDDPKIDGWFTSSDLGELTVYKIGTVLTCHGRAAEQIKIGGELVSLYKLDQLLEAARAQGNFENKVAIVSLPDERLENVIALAVQTKVSDEVVGLDSLIEKFNESVLPFERIRRISKVETIPYNALGKLERSSLRQTILS